MIRDVTVETRRRRKRAKNLQKTMTRLVNGVAPFRKSVVFGLAAFLIAISFK